MKIHGYDQSDEKPQIVLIDMWYDRHSRNWVIQCKDSNGYQIGNADYVYTKQQAQKIKTQYQNEYQTKIKSGSASMKINNVILTKNNLTEMVKSWENELSLSMGYLAQIKTDNKSEYPYNTAINRLQKLKERMNNIING